jgi:hypothetical protein
MSVLAGRGHLAISILEECTENVFGSRALVLPSFKKNKNQSFKFQKIIKINYNIVSVVVYKYAKFYYGLLCFVSYTKITKFDKICKFEIYILRSRCLLFLCSLKYKLFEQDFLYIGGTNS